MKRKRGISLIVLVITIIVIIILAGAVILSLANNNPIGQANEATFKADIDAYNSDLSMTISKKYMENYGLVTSMINAGTWDGSANTANTVKEYVPSITPEDGLKYEIRSGKLMYVGNNDTEKNWVTQLGISNTTEKLYVKNKAEIPTINKHKTPYIPVGFSYKEGVWDTGLVIQDSVGNEFVWIPVDGTNVAYRKWCTAGISYTLASDDSLPSGIAESTQITNFGGFYIARYEAGNDSGTVVSKIGKPVWVNINYSDSKAKAEAMYNTTSVKSGILTGTQWDTVVEWLKDSGKNILDSRDWGNHYNSTYPANISGFGSLKLTGYSEYWKANNIYDFAGNAWEWTSEIYNTTRLYRSGGYEGTGNSYPVSVRHNAVAPTGTHPALGFRVVLYIL